VKQVIGVDRATKDGEYSATIWGHWTRKGILVIDKIRTWKRRAAHSQTSEDQG